jgi:plastocyanin
MRKILLLFAVVALAGFGLAACGDDDDDGGDETVVEEATTETGGATGGGGEGGTLEVAAPADGSFAYEPTSLTTSAGTVTINFDNPAALSHDVVVEDESGTEVGKTDLVSEGETSTTVDLEPGTYTYYCDVAGHREGGMEGTLTVK